MKRFFSSMIEWFVPAVMREDDERYRRAYLIVVFCFVAELFFLITGIKWLKMGQMDLALNVGVAMAGLSIVPFVMKFGKNNQVSGNLILAGLFAYFSIYIVMTGGILGSALYWLFIIPFFAIMLLGSKTAIFWVVVTIVEVVWLKKQYFAGVELGITRFAADQMVSMRMENFIKQIGAIVLTLYVIEQYRVNAMHAQKKAIVEQEKAVAEQRQSQEALSRTTDGLACVLETITGNAETLSDLSGNMNTLSGELEKSCHDAQEKSSGMNANIGDIASNLMGISVAVGETSGSLDMVRNRVLEAVGVADRAVQETRFASELIQALNDSSRDIGAVTEMIKDISEQTKLLALNATIEAARAGEAGRGFAVVADEIKQLSGKTSDATGQITRRIQENDETVRQVVEKNAQVSVIIEKISGLQQEISAQVEQQSGLISDIASRVEASADQSGEISVNAEMLSEAIAVVDAGMTRIVETSGLLAEMAAGLRQAAENGRIQERENTCSTI